jgi:hypothetical protein
VFARKLGIVALCVAALLPLGFAYAERVTGYHSRFAEELANLGSYALGLFGVLPQPVGRVGKILTGVVCLSFIALVALMGRGPASAPALLVSVLFITYDDVFFPRATFGRTLFTLAAGGAVVLLLEMAAWLYLLYNRGTPTPGDGHILAFVCCRDTRLFLTPSELWFASHRWLISNIGLTVLVVFSVLVPAIDRVIFKGARRGASSA